MNQTTPFERPFPVQAALCRTNLYIKRVQSVNIPLWNAWFLLSQEAAPGQPEGNPLISILTLILPIAVIFYFFLIRPQRKEQAKRTQMLQTIKKNDRVVTIGGIYGVVTNVSTESDEVTIKVDESTNTKLRMTLGAVSRVVSDEKES